MAQLDNARAERFAQYVAKGMLPIDAFRKLDGKGKRPGDGPSATRLLKIAKARIAQIQADSKTALTMDMQERREFLARCVRLKMHEIDLDKDGDLVQEITRTEGSKGKAGVEKLKLPGKRECIMSDAELAGELTEHIEISGTIKTTRADLLAAVRRSPALNGLPLNASGNS